MNQQTKPEEKPKPSRYPSFRYKLNAKGEVESIKVANATEDAKSIQAGYSVDMPMPKQVSALEASAPNPFRITSKTIDQRMDDLSAKVLELEKKLDNYLNQPPWNPPADPPQIPVPPTKKN